MHSEHPPDAFRKEAQANLLITYGSPACGCLRVLEGQLLIQISQPSHTLAIVTFSVFSKASVKQQESRTRGQNLE